MKKFLKFGCLGVIGLFTIVIIISLVATGVTESDENNNKKSNRISRTLDISPEQGQVILDAFKELGIEENVGIENDELLNNMNSEGEKGYRVSTSDISNIIMYLNKDGNLNLIRYADRTLFENGTVVTRLSDFMLGNSEKSNLQIRSQNSIKAILKAPSTADFPNIREWYFGKDNGVITVQSYVDSQNDFGAMIRSEFQLIIENDAITSLIFEGNEFIQ